MPADISVFDLDKGFELEDLLGFSPDWFFYDSVTVTLVGL